MKLWLLRPRPNLPEKDDPWEGFGALVGVVVRAETELLARRLIVQGKGVYVGSEGELAWLSARYSICTPIEVEAAPAGVILFRDVRS